MPPKMTMFPAGNASCGEVRDVGLSIRFMRRRIAMQRFGLYAARAGKLVSSMYMISSRILKRTRHSTISP
jgi:hypothetical protein